MKTPFFGDSLSKGAGGKGEDICGSVVTGRAITATDLPRIQRLATNAEIACGQLVQEIIDQRLECERLARQSKPEVCETCGENPCKRHCSAGTYPAPSPPAEATELARELWGVFQAAAGGNAVESFDRMTLACRDGMLAEAAHVLSKIDAAVKAEYLRMERIHSHELVRVKDAINESHAAELRKARVGALEEARDTASCYARADTVCYARADTVVIALDTLIAAEGSVKA